MGENGRRLRVFTLSEKDEKLNLTGMGHDASCPYKNATNLSHDANINITRSHCPQNVLNSK